MSDRYAGIAEIAAGTDDGLIVLDLSTPEQPEHTRLRLDRDVALGLAWQLLDAVDDLGGAA